MLLLSRCPMERHVEFWKAAILRGTIAPVKAPHGKTSGLQVQAASETNVHRGWKEDENIRVQVADATASARDATALVQGRWSGHGIFVAGQFGSRWSASSNGSGAIGIAIGIAAGSHNERDRRTESGSSFLLLSPGQSFANRHDELFPGQFRLDRWLRRESAATSRRRLNRSSGSAVLATRSGKTSTRALLVEISLYH